MKIKEAIPETVVEEPEQDCMFSEISIPDETISVTSNGNESVQQNGQLEEREKQLYPGMNNENEIEVTNGYPENGHPENGIADSKDQEAGNSDTIRMPQQQHPEQECSNNAVTVKYVVDAASSSGQSALKSPSSSSAYAKTSADSTKIYGRNNDMQRDSEKFITQTKEIENGFIVHKNFDNDVERSNSVVELTKENLKNHTNKMKNDISTNQMLLQESLKEKSKSSVSDVTLTRIGPIKQDHIEEKFSEKSITISSRNTSSKKQSSNYIQTHEKCVYGENYNNSIEVTSNLPSEFLLHNCDGDNTGYQQLNDKYNAEKKHYNLENVETLMSLNKKSKTKRKRPKKVINPEECSGNGTCQGSSRINDYALIKQGSQDYNNLQNKNQNEFSSSKHDGDCDNEILANQEATSNVKKGDSHGHKRLLRRGRQHKFQRRQPVYDVSNTSTKMILLNNKYGKNSRLLTSQECHLNRGKLINPSRHQKEPSFYLSGNFHARCSTSEESVRPCVSSMMRKFDFSDRPQSDKIGDRLFEAKASVNPSRHRMCQCSLPPLPKPLNFSPPTQNERSNRYVFAWERLYSEPQLRPVSSVRPFSSLSGMKTDVHVVKVPRALAALPKKETAL